MLDNPVRAYEPLSQLDLLWLDGPDYPAIAFKVCQPYRVRYLLGDAAWRHITVPAGFVTDISSVPVGLRNIVSVVGKHTGASVVHDRLYADAGKLKVTRSLADWIFLAGMEEAGVSWWRRWAAFLAVRAAGWIIWRRHRDGRA